MGQDIRGGANEKGLFTQHMNTHMTTLYWQITKIIKPPPTALSVQRIIFSHVF